MAKQNIERLVWVDLETTGLEFIKEQIIEVAIHITDTDLNIIDGEGFVGVVHLSDETIAKMDPWNIESITKNGLIDLVRKSDKTIKQIDEEAYQYISKYVDDQASPLCGNNIAFDRRFIEVMMPKLNGHLHYRNIDVSTLKQLVQIWKPGSVMDKPSGEHEALGDIRLSIDELRYYKDLLFN